MDTRGGAALSGAHGPLLRGPRAVALVCAVLGLLCAACRHDAQVSARLVHEPAPSLTLGVLPALGRAALGEALEPLARILAAALGRPVTLRVGDSYGELARLAALGQIDIGWFAPRRADRMVAVCRPVTATSGVYHGAIVARADAGVKRLADLCGRSFAYVDRHSKSGFVEPNLLFARQGIDPLSCFTRIEFAGTHDRCLEGILEGRTDAGAVSELALRRLDPRSRPVRVLATTGPIPPDPIVVRHDLDPSVAPRVREALVGIERTAEGRRCLAALTARLGITAFAPEPGAARGGAGDAGPR